MIDQSPSRPALRYLGGKWRLAPRIISYFPPHRIYVEPFGGAASVLLRKPRSYAEVYNDLDGDVVNLFEVLRDPDAAGRLIRAVALTPFARAEFTAAYTPVNEPIERARRLVVRSFMGHGPTASNISSATGFRADAFRNHTTPAHDWSNLPPALAAVSARLQRVTIECRPAAAVITTFDCPDTLIYADPPNVHATRSNKRARGQLSTAYAVEMSDEEHEALVDQLLDARSMVVLSGYPHPLYDERLSAWRRIELNAHADGARPRTEVLWINPAADAGHGLFGSAA